MKKFNSIFDVVTLDKQEDDISEELQKLIEDRDIARLNKDYEKADEIRDVLMEKGYEIIDMAGDTALQKIKKE